MTPERTAAVVARWVRLYTRNLPTAIAQRRRDEIDADLHDHIAHERGAGTSDRRIALSIAARMLRGLAADASWRGDVTGRATLRSVVRVTLVTALILLVPLVAMRVSDGVDWSLGDFVIAAVFLGGSGMLLELAVRQPRRVAYRAAATAVGAVAIVLGEGDDAPGLVLFGCLLIGGTLALVVRTARRGD